MSLISNRDRNDPTKIPVHRGLELGGEKLKPALAHKDGQNRAKKSGNDEKQFSAGGPRAWAYCKGPVVHRNNAQEHLKSETGRFFIAAARHAIPQTKRKKN